MFKKVVIFLICFTCFSFSAQKPIANKLKRDTLSIEVKHFNANNLRDYKKQSDFNYQISERKPNVLEQIYSWLLKMAKQFLIWLFGVEKATGILRKLFVIIPYFILGLCLFVITKFFIKINANQLTKENISGARNVQVLDEESLLKSEDLDNLRNKAEADGDFRLAIRFEYLKILKQLSLTNLIDWQQQKTNDDYYHELSNSNLKPFFKQCTLMYDYVWYGNFRVNKVHYQTIKLVLDDFLTKLNKIEPKK